MSRKPKLTIDDLVDNHLVKKKGMQFNLIDTSEAKQILAHTNYYYKLGSYRKNFTKRINDDTYINLEFAYLVDLAKIDMQLRYVIIKFCLDIEHSLKTRILNDITNSTEDGYKIVDDFCDWSKKNVDDYIGFLNSSIYSKDMYVKNYDDPSIWFLVETFNFGNFSRFVEFYYERSNNSFYEVPSKILRYVKNIRNRAAHNYPIIYDISENNQLSKTSKYVSQFSSRINGISKKAASKRITNAKVHDLTAMFILYGHCVESSFMKKYRLQDIQEVLDRCVSDKNKGFYKSHANLKQVYNFFCKVVDTCKNEW
ncbi:Abi family protein [Enterococcus avium]|uniref:Abi family protein n=1 Tax=Enterococcus avium TaxID=33945 RepID=UPI0032E45737